MDELFEILTLVQCLKQNKPVKIVLYGAEFWKGLVNWMDKVLCAYKTIDRKDLFIFTIADSVEEAAQYILDDNTTSSEAIPAFLS
jgi:predicted Rossmann-fold nucleotide-binding protein